MIQMIISLIERENGNIIFENKTITVDHDNFQQAHDEVVKFFTIVAPTMPVILVIHETTAINRDRKS